MYLIALTVRNYRVHQELTLRFDRARNVVGGPNEAGKTTLVEALLTEAGVLARAGSVRDGAWT